MKTVACSAEPGIGGQGRHFAEVLTEIRAAGELARYYTTAPPQGDPDAERVGVPLARARSRFTRARFDSGVRTFVESDAFDRAVAARLVSVEGHVGFAGQALRTFERARRDGVVRLGLVSPTAHVDLVARRHAEALQRHPYERSWLGERLRRKVLAEYAEADEILVASEYVHSSFLDAGVPERKLSLRPLRVDERFERSAGRREDDAFQVVYVGSVSVVKGVPILLEAFARLEDPGARLTLVGGYGSRGMRRFAERALAADSRVRIAPGDPLPHLLAADVYVQPSFQDGFGYAPMEALACGVPVVVTEDTGMKEHVREGENGFVVPTGDADALLERLLQLRSRPLRSEAGA